MAKTVQLTADEIRTLTLFTRQYEAAQTRATVAQELNAAYQDILREKYGIDAAWVCNDVLEGFVKAGADDENN